MIFSFLYVLTAAKGNTEIVDRSGFKRQAPRKKPVRNRPPKTPVIKKAYTGKADGSAMLVMAGYGGAKYFEVELKPTTGEWKKLRASNLLTLNVSNLPSGMVTLRVWAGNGDLLSPQPSTEGTIRVL